MEVVVAWLQLLYNHLPRVTEERKEKSRSEIAVSEPRFEPGSPQYEEWMMTTQLKNITILNFVNTAEILCSEFYSH